MARVLDKSPVSLPMVLVAIGLVLPLLWPGSMEFDPLTHGVLTERLAELAVIFSLMSAGIKLDRPLGWRLWRSTWGLLAITMPLCIAALAVGGVYVLGMPLAAAVLLGAVLAPTDPVLASDVQVGPPGEGREAEVRFALTSEAGLNDGLAFPFVNLALVIAATGLAADALAQWAARDVVWKIVAGLIVGGAIGRVVAVLVFRLGTSSAVGGGLMAVVLTLGAYWGTELVHGYGFIGVFVAAMAFRRYKRDHDYHTTLHAFSERVERWLMALVLVLFGVSIAHGLLDVLTWPAVMLGLAFLFIARPAAGVCGLIGTRVPLGDRAAIAFLGIRGVGTFYYLAYALNRTQSVDEQARMIWAVAGFVVLASIVLHGSTSASFLRRNRRRRPSPDPQAMDVF